MKAPSPPAPVEAEESNTSSNEAESTPPRKKHRKPAIPLGVALMHGFSATNVGRNRLTVRLILSIYSVSDKLILVAQASTACRPLQ
jgi:hypothetical protein